MKIFIHIKGLVGTGLGDKPRKGDQMTDLSVISNAYLITEGGKIFAYGSMDLCPLEEYQWEEVVDLSGKFIFPAWCDSHTHLVFAGSREQEYVDKINGLSYEEIAAKGGGILNSAARLNQATELELYESAGLRLMEMARGGTGSVEVKSGYSMTLEGEMKMLQVIRKLKENTSQNIKATYLVHTFPLEFRDNREAYIEQVISRFIPTIADEGLADFIDVFCERGFFTEDQTDRILEAGLKHGLIPKVHANQLSNDSGGLQSAMRHGAISADHLEQIGQEDINLLKHSETMACLLPGAAFFLRLPFPPAREMIRSGLGFALATDYNPGSAPSGNMAQMLAMSCVQMKLLPAEVITAATINGACAMNVATVTGSIDVGKQADFIVTSAMPSLAYFTYSFGSNLIDQVYLKGERI